MDQRQLFQFQSHQHFFGGEEAGSALTTVKLWVGWKKPCNCCPVPAVNGLESQVGARPELLQKGTKLYVSPQLLSAANGSVLVHKLQKDVPGGARHAVT